MGRHGQISALSALVLRIYYAIGPKCIKAVRSTWAGFLGWYWRLAPHYIAASVAWIWGTPDSSGAYLGVALLPVILAPSAPRVMLRINTLASALLGVLAGSQFVDAASQPYVPLAIAAVLIYANTAAVQKCPAFVYQWTACRVEGWDLRDMVDPLGIRRYAAPWQLMEPKAHGQDTNDV